MRSCNPPLVKRNKIQKKKETGNKRKKNEKLSSSQVVRGLRWALEILKVPLVPCRLACPRYLVALPCLALLPALALLKALMVREVPRCPVDLVDLRCQAYLVVPSLPTTPQFALHLRVDSNTFTYSFFLVLTEDPRNPLAPAGPVGPGSPGSPLSPAGP